MTPQSFDINKIGDYRKRMGMSQREYWRFFGVSQRDGSRYESEGNIPDSLVFMLTLVASRNMKDVYLRSVVPANAE